jgi:hypothetical protein
MFLIFFWEIFYNQFLSMENAAAQNPGGVLITAKSLKDRGVSSK